MIGGLGLCGSYDSIRTKADVMKYAIDATMEYTSESKNARLDKALEIFNFFCEHVKLEDTDVIPLNELVSSTLDKVKDMIAELKVAVKEQAE